MEFFQKVLELFSTRRYMISIWSGFKMTLIISVFAALLGLVLGTVVAMVGLAKDSKGMKLPKLLCKLFLCHTFAFS